MCTPNEPRLRAHCSQAVLTSLCRGALGAVLWRLGVVSWPCRSAHWSCRALCHAPCLRLPVTIKKLYCNSNLCRKHCHACRSTPAPYHRAGCAVSQPCFTISRHQRSPHVKIQKLYHDPEPKPCALPRVSQRSYALSQGAGHRVAARVETQGLPLRNDTKFCIVAHTSGQAMCAHCRSPHAQAGCVVAP